MTNPKPRQDFPFWVKFTLFGLPTRASAMLSLIACLIMAGICGLLGFLFSPWFFSGLSLVVGAVIYGLAIRWVDRHGQWS